MARTGICGFFTTADAISGPSAMADFVKKVFLTMGRTDSDGDGVPDYLDKCPRTPAGETLRFLRPVPLPVARSSRMP